MQSNDLQNRTSENLTPSPRCAAPDDAGLALFTSTNNRNFTASTLIDAVGFQTQGGLSSLFREGTGLPPLGTTNGEYAWVRRMENGLALDTDNNVNDFVLVSPSGATFNGVASLIGAPGPENSLSASERNGSIFSSLFDPAVALNTSPNQVRETSPTIPDRVSADLPGAGRRASGRRIHSRRGSRLRRIRVSR